MNPFLLVFLIIFGTQVIFFLFAAINKTDKVTDLSYGLTFILGALGAIFVNDSPLNIYKTILFAIVAIWGIRLSTYLFIRILATRKDKRFDGIREDYIKFGLFWLLQAISVYIILLPVTYSLLSSNSYSITLLSLVGALISILGIVIETIADQQKFTFKNNPKNKGKWIESGLWKYSRHPNYLGEIFMWLGIAIYVLPNLNGVGYITLLSPLYIFYLLFKVSGIPTLEKEYKTRYANNNEYEQYVKNTGLLLPKFSK